MTESRRLLWVALAMTHLVVISAFVLPRPTSRSPIAIQERGSCLLPLAAKAGGGEYSVVEDDDDDLDASNEAEVVRAAAPTVQTKVTINNQDDDTDDNNEQTTASTTTNLRFEYAAMPPGTSVHIQVGDLALARKAWKKRRRSGSPLLVPCSILNIDRMSMLRWNAIYLLQKFGTAQKDGMVLSLADLTKRHKSHLRSPLSKHATALGYGNPRGLIEGLFRGKAQTTYGVQLVATNDDLFLKAPISKYRALKKVEQVTMLQVVENASQEDTMKHTGYIRVKAADSNTKNNNNNNNNKKKEDDNKTDDSASNSDHAQSPQKYYKFPPLSAALRINPREDISNDISQGSLHAAVVLDFDEQGDAGAPLLTLSLGGASALRRNSALLVDPATLRSKQRQQQDLKNVPIKNPRYMLQDLKVGDGPILDAKVVKLAKDHAMVDLGVGRKFTTSTAATTSIGTPDMVRVYGKLRFQDAVDTKKKKRRRNSYHETRDDDDEDDEPQFTSDDDDANMEEMFNSIEDLLNDKDLEEGETSEDITHLFQMNEDGSMSYQNPETGEMEIVMTDDDDDDDLAEDDEVEDDEEEDISLEAVVDDGDDEVDDDAEIQSRRNDPSQRREQYRPTLRLHVGDLVPVYILKVAKQSGQFMVTTDPSAVRGKTAKKIKQEEDVKKKLERLSEILGGLDRLHELKGQEWEGTVKATSQTGDWLYVQPTSNNDGADPSIKLPVGVATVSDESSGSYVQGDTVRIRLNGIDRKRGQLAMRVLGKLAP